MIVQKIHSEMLSSSQTGLTLIIDEAGVSGERVACAILKGEKSVMVEGRRGRSVQKILPQSVKGSIEERKGEAMLILNTDEVILECGDGKMCRNLASTRKCESPTVAVVHCEVTSPLSIQRLSSIADRIVRLSEKEGKTHAIVITVKRNGLKEQHSLWLSLTPSQTLRDEKEQSVQVHKTVTPVTQTDVKGKDSLQLPYVAAKTEEGLVSIHRGGKVKMGGRVIYSPDDADDLDDSDPDDDLHI